MDLNAPHPDNQPGVLTEAIGSLLTYCRDNGWAGYDPYDALNSRFFARTPLARFRLGRLALTQGLKRCPINLRPLLRVPREQNPKGIALFTSAVIRLCHFGLCGSEQAMALADRLLELRSPGIKVCCWGYNFDWQTRKYLVPRWTPNIICTSFAGNALLDAYEAFERPCYRAAAEEAGRFILEGLNRSTDGEDQCLSYTPLDRARVHNANLLGAAFLARLHGYTEREDLRSTALACARFSVKRQGKDGAWFYGEDATQRWIDSFHTGYNLCALEMLRRRFPQETWLVKAIENGFRYFMENFFTPDPIVKYYHDRVYPVDAHAIAQALVTLTELRRYSPQAVPLAQGVAHWALANMRGPTGYFYFQRQPYYTIRTPYMRWAQAWMLLGMTRLLAALACDGPSPAVLPKEPIYARTTH